MRRSVKKSWKPAYTFRQSPLKAFMVLYLVVHTGSEGVVVKNEKRKLKSKIIILRTFTPAQLPYKAGGIVGLSSSESQ